MGRAWSASASCPSTSTTCTSPAGLSHQRATPSSAAWRRRRRACCRRELGGVAEGFSLPGAWGRGGLKPSSTKLETGSQEPGTGSRQLSLPVGCLQHPERAKRHPLARCALALDVDPRLAVVGVLQRPAAAVTLFAHN